MDGTSKKVLAERICAGLLAHVDAGKTTLSEAILYTSGSIRKFGRVDNKDAYLDTFELERARGITIFSKQAVLKIGDRQITLLDTPGHVDFSTEMERTLQVLDYGILVISGADGVQGHTRVLWDLLKRYGIPVFLFINKMDQNGTDKLMRMAELKAQFGDGCIDFEMEGSDAFFEEAAVGDEAALEEFIEAGAVSTASIRKMIAERKIFPCYFGSALKLQGIDTFLQGLDKYMTAPCEKPGFGAKVFKIARDSQGNRLTYMKLTGGTLSVRDMLATGESGQLQEKVSQIRIYSGEKFEVVNEAEAGDICAVAGLEKTFPGQGLGLEASSGAPVLTPVLTYQLILPEGVGAAQALPKLKQLEDEDPSLHIVWHEGLKEIHVQLMGEVQLEILKHMIQKRFGIEAAFGSGNIVYKETIENKVEGVGHFEPLRHYAEVHLILEPLQRGSGLIFDTACSEDVLDGNWQRLILTHLKEKTHIGVLGGFPITDMKITLASGKAHQKHTEGGDFRQATYRAVRQGLMQAQSVLLEPYYTFRLEVPATMIGRAMADMEKINGKFEAPSQLGETAVLTGSAPVSAIRDYPKTLAAYTKGQGRIALSFLGYDRCSNPEPVILAAAYDPDRDLENPAGSVFCARGAGFNVPWDKVCDYMHLERVLKDDGEGGVLGRAAQLTAFEQKEAFIDREEIDAIIERTFYANSQKKAGTFKFKRRRQEIAEPVVRTFKPKESQEEYLLVDGYNIIFAWDDLKALASKNIDSARDCLTDILCNYQAIRQCRLIVVFDAYKVAGGKENVMQYKNIYIVYTKEAETADQYIEKFAHENGGKYKVTVATSDGLEQMIIRSKGCSLLSARELLDEIKRAGEHIQKAYLEKQPVYKNRLEDSVGKETLQSLKENLSE